MGDRITCARGSFLLEWAAASELLVVNGPDSEPTLIRWNGTSNVDLTLIEERARGGIKFWGVMEESSSDHRR